MSYFATIYLSIGPAADGREVGVPLRHLPHRLVQLHPVEALLHAAGANLVRMSEVKNFQLLRGHRLLPTIGNLRTKSKTYLIAFQLFFVAFKSVFIRVEFRFDDVKQQQAVQSQAGRTLKRKGLGKNRSNSGQPNR
jgi:hypothetical protein